METDNRQIILTNNLCRACMNSTDNMISLFDFVDLELSRELLNTLFFKCTSIQVTKDDIYSNYICELCLKRLINAYLFREDCCKTHEKLEQLYQDRISSFCNPVTNISTITTASTVTTTNVETFYILNEHLKTDYSKDELVEQNEFSQEPVEFIAEDSFENCNQLIPRSFISGYNGDNTSYTRNKLTEECENKIEPVKQSCNINDAQEHLNSFTCLECKKKFYSKSGLRKHMKIHTESEKLKCTICKKQFTRTTDVNRHMSTHTGAKPFVCNICGSSFTQSGTLNIHLRKHKEFNDLKKLKKRIENKPHLCPICGKAFRESSALTIHIRRHNGYKPYICGVCGMRFVSSGRLTSHKRIHTGERPFSCKYCEKSFSQSTVLSKHLKTHLEIKPHQCCYCPKSFSTLYYLNIHKRKHTGEKPLKCTICEKSFSDPKILKQHTKIHAEEKPFLCIICGKAFRRKHHLKSHLKTHEK